MKSDYLLLNVSDNANYGDLLFPVLLKVIIHSAHPEARIVNCAPTRSDWSSLGALPTSSYRDFVEEVKNNREVTIIVGGGGLFNTAWEQLVWRLSSSFRTIYKYRHSRRLLNRMKAVRRILSPIPIHLPFVLSDENFANAHVYYNSVGGFSMDHRALDMNDVRHLKRANTKLTIRDHTLMRSVEQYKVAAELVPDSALIMSDLFPREVLVEKVRPEILDFIQQAKYFCVQIGKDLGPKDQNEFVEKLIGEAAAAGYELLLCPIKYRIPNRIGDEAVLAELAERYPKLKFIVPHNIFETMLLIANSGGYLGTSLHGFITAYSFEVPAFGFSDVEKLKAYIETWANPEDHLVEPSQATSVFSRASDYRLSEIATRCKIQKELVYENLRRIFGFRHQCPKVSTPQREELTF